MTNQDSDNLIKRRGSDGAVLETATVGTPPMQVAFDAADIGVTSARSATLTKLEK